MSLQESGLEVKSGAFSWSCYRKSMFDFCRRAYFLHYYGAGDGWESFSESVPALLYRLKYLETSSRWIEKRFMESLNRTLCSRRNYLDNEHLERLLEREIFKGINSKCAELVNMDWELDPKKLNFMESYYGDIDSKVLFEEIKARLHSLISMATLPSGVLDMFRGVSHFKFKSLVLPVYFFASDIKVWTAPQVIWSEFEKLKIFNFVMSRPDDMFSISLKHSIQAMFVSRCYGVSLDAIDTMTFFGDKGMDHIFTGRVDESETSKIICDDSEKMLELICDDATVRDNDFPKALGVKCDNCRFREYCRR